MKELNEKTEFIIKYRLEPKNTEGKEEGDKIPHKKVVSEVSGFQINDERGYFKVYFDRDSILSLAKQIEMIESEEIDSHWDKNLPF